ncbi:Cytochrome P450 [Naviculisporaceae sp. PSN 640]
MSIEPMSTLPLAVHLGKGRVRLPLSKTTLALPHLTILVLIITLSFLVIILVRRYNHLSHIPGPFPASLTNLWRFSKQYNAPIQPLLYQLHKTHGPIVRIGPNTVSISSPADITSVFGARAGFTKSDSYGGMRTFIPGNHGGGIGGTGSSIGSIIDIQDEKRVKAIKRAIGTVFLSKNLEAEYKPDVDTTISNLISSLQRRAEKEEPFNLYNMVQHFQLDFLLRIAFGEDAGCLRRDEDVLGLTGLTYRRLQHWYKWQAVPHLERFIFQNWLWSGRMVGKSRWAREGAARVEKRKTTREAGKATATEHDGKRKDLLDKYLAASELHPEAIPPRLLFNLVNSTIAAGTDTTVGTVTVLFYFLLTNPEVRVRLLEEISSAVREEERGVPVKYATVKGLPYLDAVIKETLRLLAVLGTTLERTVPAQGAVVAGVHLPGGTVVGCSPYVVHRDEETFGEKVDEFRPDRWLVGSHGYEISEEKRIAMEHATLSWSHGSRTCLGRNLATIEMKKLIPSILLNFEFKLCEPTLDIKFGRGILESEENPIMVRVSRKQ